MHPLILIGIVLAAVVLWVGVIGIMLIGLERTTAKDASDNKQHIAKL